MPQSFDYHLLIETSNASLKKELKDNGLKEALTSSKELVYYDCEFSEDEKGLLSFSVAYCVEQGVEESIFEALYDAFTLLDDSLRFEVFIHDEAEPDTPRVFANGTWATLSV